MIKSVLVHTQCLVENDFRCHELCSVHYVSLKMTFDVMNGVYGQTIKNTTIENALIEVLADSLQTKSIHHES